MSRFARWFVILGIMAALPAAVLLGAGAGELLRQPGLGLAHLLIHGPLIGALAFSASLLFGTAAGLHAMRHWALLLGFGESVLLMLAGVGMLMFGGAVIGAVGGAPQLALGTVPFSLGAVLFGARLLTALWGESGFVLPFDRDDARTVGTAVGVVAGVVLGHVLVVGLAS
jgi:hypothetical protein